MKFIRIGICALVVFGIAAHGAVEDWARAVLEIGAALLFLAWAVRAYLTKEHQLIISPLLLPLGFFLLFGLAQWLFHRTASSYATRMELQLLLADILVLFLAGQAFRTLQDWREFVWFVMFFGFAVALFGILQHFTFNGKLYWFREMHYGGIPFGPYVNRNHFAGFAELVIPVSLVPLALGKVRRERWFLVSLFAVVPIGALFLSASRGGIVSFAVETGVLVLWLLVRRTAGKHLLSAGAVLLGAFLMVSWLGVQQAVERFSSLQALEVTIGKRASMRSDTWHIFLDHPLLGTGLGTLQIVFPPYETLYDGKVVNHTHNDYLEALAETGIAGGLCCAWFLGVLLFDSLSRLSQPSSAFASAIQLSALVACLGFLIHSLVDFNLRIPGNALLFLLLANLATYQVRETVPQIPKMERSRFRRRKH
ncbi:MAG TPA: O-antigen ligase family protein [Candidatus Acidoferrum sp.]|nr:O-antigen ligase family protein [Candidatus Acidoferrum sp.]